MTETFRVARLPSLIFGAGAFSQVPDLLTRRGCRAIVAVTGGRSVRGREEWSAFLDVLTGHGIELIDFTVRGEPGPDLIDSCVQQLRQELPQASAVVAIGGGSVVDAGKAIAAAFKMPQSVKTYLEGVGTEVPPGATLPVVAVPTTAGTGSEATKNAVLSSVGKGGFKKSLRHENFIPTVAVLDPLLYQSCPPAVAIPSGLDAVTQLIESHVSTQASPFTRLLSEQGLRLVGDSFTRIADGRGSVDDWGNMAYAAYLGGICLGNAGLGAVHGLASPIGALHEIPHGVFCGLLVSPSIERTLEKARSEGHESGGLEVVNLYDTVASMVLGRDARAGDLVKWLYDISRSLGTLGSYGFTDGEIAGIAEASGRKNHPVDLDSDDLLWMLRSRL